VTSTVIDAKDALDEIMIVLDFYMFSLTPNLTLKFDRSWADFCHLFTLSYKAKSKVSLLEKIKLK